MSGSARAVALVISSLSVLVTASSAQAALPSSATFGPAIDSPAYEGQSRCSPGEKPGMVAFRRIVMARYPQTGYGNISRACHIGGQSEHKEGRAWDWGMNAASASDREIVKDLFAWLFAEDRYGNEAAMAKRFGIMYVIWNRRIWGAWGGWDTYCVQKPRGCIDPEDKDPRSPHTDHVHFSMSRAGAQMKTTFWNRERSMLAAIAAHPEYGYWELGRNGGVSSFGTGWYGSKSDVFLPKAAVAMTSTASGYGYWIVTKNGKVFAFGDARRLGGLTDRKVTVTDIEATPTGRGYWLLSKSGRVAGFGDAGFFGGARASEAPLVGMSATPTGLGYWVYAADGKVFASGDAPDLGGAAGKDLASPVVGGDNLGTEGHWLVTATGRVHAIGEAPALGHSDGGDSQVVGLSANAAGTGYWVLAEKGRLVAFGDAPELGSLGN